MSVKPMTSHRVTISSEERHANDVQNAIVKVNSSVKNKANGDVYIDSSVFKSQSKQKRTAETTNKLNALLGRLAFNIQNFRFSPEGERAKGLLSMVNNMNKMLEKDNNLDQGEIKTLDRQLDYYFPVYHFNK
jgi:hypothetical protein